MIIGVATTCIGVAIGSRGNTLPQSTLLFHALACSTALSYEMLWSRDAVATGKEMSGDVTFNIQGRCVR